MAINLLGYWPTDLYAETTGFIYLKTMVYILLYGFCVLQVIRQFEEFSAPDVVISLARNAIAIADDDDENLVSTLNVACLCYHDKCM